MREEKKFNDCEINSQDFQFYDSKEIRYKNATMYTDEFSTQSVETSTNKQTRTIKFQVEAEQIYNAFKSKEQENVKVDEKKLGRFLKSVCPTVISALNESMSLKLLHNFEPMSSNSRRETLELYTVQNVSQKLYEIERQLEITDIQWNSSGLIIAASYGRLEHEGTCHDKSYICAWNIARRDFQTDKATYQLETSGCVMCLSFHPTKPSLLAAGFFTGQIMLYDLSVSEMELCQSEIDEYFHRESVTQLQWIDSRMGGIMNNSLLSLGNDGKMLLWPINYENFNLKFPLKGHHLLRKKESQVESVGGTCFAQCSEDATNYIIGSEGGSVLRGIINPISLDKKGQNILEQREFGITWKEEAQMFMNNANNKYLPEVKAQVDEYCKKRGIIEVYIKNIVAAKPDIRKLYINPISFAYEAHYGTVFGISSSQFFPNLFATCSMDGQIRLYDMLNARALLTFEYFSQYILSIQFSPQRPSVFAAASSDGGILLFDLMANRKKEVLVIRPTTLKSTQSATNIRFNKKQIDLLACSYNGCQIRVYQLGDQFVKFNEMEENFLAKFLDEQRVG